MVIEPPASGVLVLVLPGPIQAQWRRYGGAMVSVVRPVLAAFPCSCGQSAAAAPEAGTNSSDARAVTLRAHPQTATHPLNRPIVPPERRPMRRPSRGAEAPPPTSQESSQ